MMIKGDMADMMIKEIFGKVKIYRLHTRVDNRGPRTTGDNYYESCIVVIEGNQIEITE